MTDSGNPSFNAELAGAGARAWLGGHDTQARGLVERRLAGVPRPPTGPLDAAFLTPRSVEEALHFARKLRDRLTPGGTLTVIRRKTAAEPDENTPASPDPLGEALSGVGFRFAGRSSFDDDWDFARFTLAGD